MIKFDVKGDNLASSRLKVLPAAAIRAGLRAALEYLQKAVKKYPPQKYISRAAAYPEKVIQLPSGKVLVGWDSVKQWRYVMAAISSGKIQIPYRRTNTLANAYKFVQKPQSVEVVNNAPYAQYVVGNQQARMMALRGWKTGEQTQDAKRAGVVRAFRAAVREALAGRK